MTPTQAGQAIHNAATLTEIYAVKDAARYLRERNRLAGCRAPAARRHSLETAARMMRDAFEVAERTRAMAGPITLPFDVVPGAVVRRSDDGIVLGHVHAAPAVPEVWVR